MLALSRLPICLTRSLLPLHARPTCQFCVHWDKPPAAVNDNSKTNELAAGGQIGHAPGFKAVSIIPGVLTGIGGTGATKCDLANRDLDVRLGSTTEPAAASSKVRFTSSRTRIVGFNERQVWA